MKPHTPIPLVLCEGKDAIPSLPIDWNDAAFVPLRQLLVEIAGCH